MSGPELAARAAKGELVMLVWKGGVEKKVKEAENLGVSRHVAGTPGRGSAALRPLVTVGYFTGWRKGELLNLQWRNIDTTAKTIRLDPGTTKNREGRLFVYAGITELEETITKLAKARDALRREGTVCPYVFHRDGQAIKSFRRSWLTACKQAGVPGRLVHDLRRTAVRNLERAGVPRSTAMAMVGNKTESIYRRYAIVSESDLKAAAAKLQAATVTITVTMGQSA